MRSQKKAKTVSDIASVSIYGHFCRTAIVRILLSESNKATLDKPARGLHSQGIFMSMNQFVLPMKLLAIIFQFHHKKF